MKFKETAEDMAVKYRLWGATEREVSGFSKRYAEAHVVGERETELQSSICSAAKAKGYKKYLVRGLARAMRRGERDAKSEILAAYREELGL